MLSATIADSVSSDSSVELSQAETLLLYLVNRTRRFPEVWADRFDVSLPADQVGTFAPVVVNASLLEAARLHSDEMLARNTLSHYGADGSSPGDRALRSGYPTNFVGENVGYDYNYPSYSADAIAVRMNDGWFNSPGHRANMLKADWTEFGGSFFVRQPPGGTQYSTELFGKFDAGPFLTGVIFADHDGDVTFNATEGLGGVTVTASGPAGTYTTSSLTAGGWTLKVPAGEYVVTVSGGAFQGSGSAKVAVGTKNVAVDFVSGTASGWVDFVRFANSAPTLGSGSLVLPPVYTATERPLGIAVEELLGSTFADVDPLTPVGIAITGAATGSASGAWEYSVDAGATWRPLGSPATDAARLLRGQDLIRFVPLAGSPSGSASLSFRAWDQTSGTWGLTADTTANGGHTAFSATALTATVATVLVNTAPVLAPSGGGLLESIPEDSPSPVGTTVASLLGSSMTDVDPGTPVGMVITGVTGSANGTWEYSIDGGAAWQPMGAISAAAALPLAATHRVRFNPAANVHGSATMTYRAWDQSAGSAGVLVDLSESNALGGASAFSASSRTVSITVTPVNDSPEFRVGHSALRLRPLAANSSFDWTGTTIADLLGNSFFDPDGTTSQGIALIGLGGGGSWSFNTGGSGWWSGGIAPQWATLLRPTDRLGFAPDSGFTGDATVSFRLWDQTAGTAGFNGANLSNASVSTGGATAFGGEILTARIFVGAAGAAPVASFGTPQRAADGRGVVSIPLTFSRSVEGLDRGDLTLTRDGSPVSLGSATLSGSAESFVLGDLGEIASVPGVYSLTLTGSGSGVTDSVGNRLASNVSTSFRVEAAPQPPVGITLSSATIPENRPLNSLVGSFTTSDPDSSSFTYTLVAGSGYADNAFFEVAGNELRAKQSFNYELQNSYSIRIRSTDPGGLSVEQVFGIGVTDVNEPPVGVSLRNAVASLSESADTSVSIKVADIDISDDALGVNALSLSGPDAAWFQLGDQGALALRAGVTLEYAIKPALSVTISARDASLSGSSAASVGYSLAVIPRSPHLAVAADGWLSIDGQPVTYAGSAVTAAFQSWTIFEATAIRGQNVFFAQHASGRGHRLLADAAWALIGGLEGVGSAYSIDLPRSARGANFPVAQEPEPLPAGLLLPAENSGTALRIDMLGRLYADRAMLTEAAATSSGITLAAVVGSSPVAVGRQNADSNWRNTLLWQDRVSRDLVEWQFDSNWRYGGISRTPTESVASLEVAYQVDINRDSRIG